VPRGLLAYRQDRGGRQQDLPDREPLCGVAGLKAAVGATSLSML